MKIFQIALILAALGGTFTLAGCDEQNGEEFSSPSSIGAGVVTAARRYDAAKHPSTTPAQGHGEGGNGGGD